MVFGHLNINSLRTKFDFLCEQIKGPMDDFMISESKLNDSFPHGQLLIDGFHTPFRFDRNKNGGGILLYVREDIPAKISLRTKFDFLCEQIKGPMDDFMISESKLNDSFPHGQLLIDGFHTPFRFDRNKNGGGILLYVREDIPAKILSHEPKSF